MSKTLSEWLTYIEQIHVSAIHLGLERALPLAQTLGLTKFSCPVIMVGGTNGKGSVVRSLEHFYVQAGYRVGVYTSPHLLRFNERIRVNQHEITDFDLIASFEMIEKQRNHGSLTAFEFTTLAALYFFQQQPLDLLILEVGLGGRLDAVNVVAADIAVITSVGIDHTDRLGPDRESIGFEKAGIFRSKQQVVCGDADPPHSLLKQAKMFDCDFYQRDKNFHVDLKPSGWDWRSQARCYQDLPLPQLKCQNLASALMVLELLDEKYPIPEVLIRQEIKNISLEGRFEQVKKDACHYILDVAHNPDSTQWLAEQLLQLKAMPKKIAAVVGMLKDKPIKDSLQPLLPCIDEWYAVDLSAATPRGEKSEQISLYLQALGVEICYNFGATADALEAIQKKHSFFDYIVVFGSFYTVAQAKQALLKI